MKFKAIIFTFFTMQLSLAVSFFSFASEEQAPVAQEVEKGPNNGRMLREGDFAIELAIFEQGVPPEFRVFVTKSGAKVAPSDVDINVNLVRLGDKIDDIQFKAEGGYLRGDMEIYEPHSFIVNLSASYQGKRYQWSYDNFEGRTEIKPALAKAMGIETARVSKQEFYETVSVFGRLTLPPSAERHISARFPGEIKKLNVAFGEMVKKGQALMTIESNESLQQYQVYSPSDGVITYQDAGVGEQAGQQKLLTITNTNTLVAQLSVFPMEQAKVKLGADVQLRVSGSEQVFTSKIDGLLHAVNAQQAKIFLATIDNSANSLRAGQFVSADIVVDTYTVPLAVKASGLQSFRDFTVVFAKVGQQYEVRMLNLGRKSGSWVEVYSGINEGTEYVTENSYIIKADIDKSGASHDH